MKTALLLLLLAIPCAASDDEFDATLPREVWTYKRTDTLYDRYDAEPSAARQARELIESRLKLSPLDQGLLWRYARACVLEAQRASWLSRRRLLQAAYAAAEISVTINPSDEQARRWLATAESGKL
jgi:hypothetical protein